MLTVLNGNNSTSALLNGRSHQTILWLLVILIDPLKSLNESLYIMDEIKMNVSVSAGLAK